MTKMMKKTQAGTKMLSWRYSDGYHHKSTKTYCAAKIHTENKHIYVSVDKDASVGKADGSTVWDTRKTKQDTHKQRGQGEP